MKRIAPLSRQSTRKAIAISRLPGRPPILGRLQPSPIFLSRNTLTTSVGVTHPWSAASLDALK